VPRLSSALDQALAHQSLAWVSMSQHAELMHSAGVAKLCPAACHWIGHRAAWPQAVSHGRLSPVL
jgi:hypothetical protein